VKPIVVIIAVLGLGAAAIAVTASGKPSAPKPDSKPVKRYSGLPLSAYETKRYYALADFWRAEKTVKGKRPWFASKSPLLIYTPEQAGFDLKPLNATIMAGFAKRREGLPVNASSHIDEYGTEGVWTFGTGLTAVPGKGIVVTDEYGRPASGVGINLGAALLNTAQTILPYIPGIGTAASAALSTAIAIGQGKSLKDAALAGARAALPAPAQMAFDLGVAVISGTPVDKAAKDALLKQIPGGPTAYEQGKTLAKQVGVTS